MSATQVVIPGPSGGSSVQPVSSTAPFPVSVVAAAGTPITWTRTTVALGGGSQTMVGANAARRELRIINPAGNGAIAYDPSGGTVTAANGIPVVPGGQEILTDIDCPRGAVTVIGTNTQTMYAWEGV